ncbi:MAG: 3-methyl-2-oxobutanoate hydroxymethyltransferase [Gammaproteobacteria bacterium]|nr:3-methyl-2-oxobutanoate hydroxymethyltransferase [Gammaproteobacteria bacterium]NNC98502.1 3-methyl-2-oxobutanoate hydroxymethyltransferase [Gammaproteobacteria bacterium]NNM13483.1 3-methyl-2-oxobutanoate hydroxymethyltransferase [Gammaproteobacteria bacterium]
MSNLTTYTHLQRKSDDKKPVTISSLKKMKQAGEKIACLTAYDASFAALVDEGGTDLVLVGDSLGMVINGHATTVPVTVDQIIYHTQAVKAGLQRAFLLVDMPFMSYADKHIALQNATRLMQEGLAHMVKLEGGELQVPTVEYLAERGVPVCAHIGLTPQYVHKMGGFKVQGREQQAAEQMIKEAKQLEDAGADIVLLECVPSALGKAVTEALSVPTIGIGAGPDCNGQILVLYDILDVTFGRKPRFAKNYMQGSSNNLEAIKSYVSEVKSGAYPAAEHCFS